MLPCKVQVAQAAMTEEELCRKMDDWIDAFLASEILTVRILFRRIQFIALFKYTAPSTHSENIMLLELLPIELLPEDPNPPCIQHRWITRLEIVGKVFDGHDTVLVKLIPVIYEPLAFEVRYTCPLTVVGVVAAEESGKYPVPMSWIDLLKVNGTPEENVPPGKYTTSPFWAASSAACRLPWSK